MLSLLLDCHELPERIRKGHDTPFPVRRVEIPKPDGEMRKLGIPTVIALHHPIGNITTVDADL